MDYCKKYKSGSGRELPDRWEKQSLNTSQWPSRPKERGAGRSDTESQDVDSTIKLEKEVHWEKEHA